MFNKLIHSSLQSKRLQLWNNLFNIGRCSSTFSKSTKEEAVVLSEDGNIVICWHPETPMPYEMTKPLPAVEKSSSPLRSSYDDRLKDTFRHKHPYFVHKHLTDVTFTDKNVWYPKRADKFVKFKEQEPKDREYL